MLETEGQLPRPMAGAPHLEGEDGQPCLAWLSPGLPSDSGAELGPQRHPGREGGALQGVYVLP